MIGLLLPFFGNHPGGRFLEYFDFLIILSAAILYFQNQFYKNRNFLFLIGIFICLLVPILSNFTLWKDWEHYHINIFLFLKSTELEPFFPLKQITKLWAFAILSLSSFQNRKNFQFFLYGIISGFCFTIAIGLLEFFSYDFLSLLDRYQIWLSGYTDRFPNHFSKLGISVSIKSLFWNRSWLAMYILSVLPILLFVFAKTNQKLIYKIGFYLFLFFILVLVGSRGAVFTLLLSWATIGIIFKFNTKNKSIWLTSFVIIFFLSYVYLLLQNTKWEMERSLHLQAGLKMLSLSPLSGFGLDSYGWVNENILRCMQIASRFHSSHNDYLNFAIGNGLLALIGYIFLHTKLISKWKNSPRFLTAILTILLYKNFQEWTYINAILFPFIWILLYSLRKSKISFLWFTPILVFHFISLFVFPSKIYPGFGIYFNPLDTDRNRYTILQGNYLLPNQEQMQTCRNAENPLKRNLKFWEVFLQDKTLDPESRIFCEIPPK